MSKIDGFLFLKFIRINATVRVRLLLEFRRYFNEANPIENEINHKKCNDSNNKRRLNE